MRLFPAGPVHRLCHRHHVVAQRVEMTAHLRARGSLVHFEDGVHDSFVLGHGEGHQPRVKCRFPAVGFQPITQLDGLGSEITVVAGRVDAPVEVRVGSIERDGIVDPGGFSAGLMRRGQKSPVFRGMPARCEHSTRCFEEGHGLEHLRQFDDGRRGDKRTRVRAELDQSLRGETLKRFANGGSRSAMARGKRVLIEPRSRPEPSRDDLSLDCLPDSVAVRRHGFGDAHTALANAVSGSGGVGFNQLR